MTEPCKAELLALCDRITAIVDQCREYPTLTEDEYGIAGAAVSSIEEVLGHND